MILVKGFWMTSEHEGSVEGTVVNESAAYDCVMVRRGTPSKWQVEMEPWGMRGMLSYEAVFVEQEDEWLKTKPKQNRE